MGPQLSDLSSCFRDYCFGNINIKLLPEGALEPLMHSTADLSRLKESLALSQPITVLLGGSLQMG